MPNNNLRKIASKYEMLQHPNMKCFSIYEESLRLSNAMGIMCSPNHARNAKIDIRESKSEPSRTGHATKITGMSIAEIAQTMTSDAQNQAPLLEMLSELLQEQIRVSDRCRPVSQEQSSFEGSCCHLSVAFYVQRIVRYSGASPCCLVATLLYLERFRQRRPAVRLTSSTLQRLLLVAAMRPQSTLRT